MLRILLLFVFFLSYIIAQSELVIKNSSDSFYEFKLDMHEDKTNSLDFKDIQKIKYFQKYQNRISLGYSDSSFWFRLKITNKSNQDVIYFIQSVEKLAHVLDCYIVSKDNRHVKYSDGIHSFVNGANNLLDNPTFEVKLKKDESKTVYIKMSSIYPNYTKLQVLNKDELSDYRLSHDKLYFLYFGTFIALIAYNLFIFMSIRKIHYLYYVFYGISLLSWQLLLTGFYPFDTFTSIFYTYTSGVLISIIICFFLLFSQSILNTKELLAKDDKILSYIIYIFILYSIGYILFVQEFLFLINFTVTFVLPYIIYVAIKSYNLGNKTAFYYLLAQVPFIVSATIYSLMSQGYIEYTLFTRHSIVIGSFFEMLIFSFALAHRLKILEEEKLELSNQNLEIAKKLNSKLETQIAKRTQELQIAKDKAEKSSKFKAEFLADMTHQIRTPLANLMMNAEMMRDEYNSDDNLEIFIDQIDASTNMLSNSYEDLMYVTSHDSIDYQPVNISVSDTLKRRIKFFSTLSKIHQKELKTNIEDDIYININPTELERVIDNNLSNGIKYATANRPIIISLKQKEKVVIMIFKTYGNPIQNKDMVFEKSYRENEAKRGLGLGLNIVKNICKKYNIEYILSYEDKQNIFEYRIYQSS